MCRVQEHVFNFGGFLVGVDQRSVDSAEVVEFISRAITNLVETIVR